VNAIAFRDATLRLGGRAVLAGVSLEIATGEFVGVLGPNGAGKTTLMRAILGLLAASSGTIQVLGRPAARGNPAIGYVPQMRSAFGTIRLSGFDFVAGIVDCQFSASRPAPKSTVRSIWSALANWRAARWSRPRAASGSACCWPKRLSVVRNCCCWTSRL